MNDPGIRADSDVLRDDTEPRAGFGETAFEAGLAGELVLEPIQIEHEEGVAASGFEEGVVPLECGEALSGALAVEGLEELALRVVPCSCAYADAGKQERNAAAMRNLKFLMAMKISRGRGRR
jgi:hypothetical protein